MPIRTEEDYRSAMREIAAYFDNEPEPGSPDGKRFEVLPTLVDTYETKRFPVDLPDPVEAIKFRMEQAGLTEQRRGIRWTSLALVHPVAVMIESRGPTAGQPVCREITVRSPEHRR
jgi:hypothetical protein